MINYVNNAYDKTLKPCDAQQFNTLVASSETERLILAHRGGDARAKAKLPALTYMGVLDTEKYKQYLRQCEEQGAKPLGSRRVEFMRPTGLLMLDFDHVGRSPHRDGVILNEMKDPSESQAKSQREILRVAQDDTGAIDSPVKLWEYIKSRYDTVVKDTSSPLGGSEGGSLALAHVTPSGDGLRDGVILNEMKDPSEPQAKSQREILRVAQDDTDAIDSPVKLWEYIVDAYKKAGVDMSAYVALAHITPSGDGLRVVVKRTKGTTIEQEQYEWCKAMKLGAIGIKPDPACKDISRLSFAPMQQEILYFNPSLLFGELPDVADYPDGSLWGGVYADPLRSATPCSAALVPLKEGQCFSDSCSAEDTAMKQTKEHCPSETGGRAEGSVDGTERRGYDVSVAFPTDYNGIEYGEIIKRLEEQLGGRPEHGARNSFIFTMACNLRYICNDDAQWIAAILPTYGEDPQKHRATIASAVNRPMSRTMPETMARALRIGVAGKTVAESVTAAAPPEMPAVLPDLIALLTSRTPERMKPAVAMAVFPPLGAHLHETKFRYWDGRDYEATFMHVLVAELSSGKSAVNAPIEYIIADMEARDEVARNKENEWKAKCATISSAKDKPERPKGLSMQVLSSDMTNAAFVQRLADAEGKFLYTQMDEVELLNALKTNTQGNTVSAILRLAFDCGKYGQERVASNAVNAKVRVRWNWNASTTIQRVRKFFAKNIADGTLSRLSFATITKDDDDWGDVARPTFGEYGQAFADELLPYIDALCNVSGTVVCPEAIQWADALSLELIGYAREIDDRTYAQLSFRAVLMGFFRAVLLYVANGCRWSTVIGDFAAWTVRYDLWCKMRFFRDMLHKDLEGEKTALQRGPVSLLALLPDEFTKQQVQELRIAEGMNPDSRKMLDNWKRRGYVSFDDVRKVFVKCPQSSVLS